MPLQLIDTHCHLDAQPLAQLGLDRVLARAHAAGVGRIVVPAVEPRNFNAVRELAGRYEGVFFALGIHPLCVDACDESAIDALDMALSAAASDAKLVAVGEIGLDSFVVDVDVARQELFYRAQLELAQRHGLPVLLHVRRAQDRILKYLREIPVRGGIAHAFNGSSQQAAQFIERGLALGFGGAMTWERARRIRRLAAEVPLDAIVLETDAPDIPPAWLAAGVPNEPGQLARIAAELARLRGLSVAEIAHASTRNAQRLMPALAG